MLLFPAFPLLLLLLLLLLRPLLLLLLFWGGRWVWEFCAVLPDRLPEFVLPEAALAEVKEHAWSLLTLAGLVGSYAGKAVVAPPIGLLGDFISIANGGTV